MQFKLIAAAALAAMAVAAPCQGNTSVEKPNTFWVLGSPFGIEHQLDASMRPSTIAAYIDLYTRGNSDVIVAPELEYTKYSGEQANGLGVSARLALIDGLRGGPVVSYVTRPRKGAAFRVGLGYLFGSGDVVGTVLNLGVGWRF